MANPEHLELQAAGVNLWNKWRARNPEIAPDLSDSSFNNQQFAHWNLSQTNFVGSVFVKCTFSDANLNGAIFNNSQLIDMNLSGAELTKASLRGANLEGADLRVANLQDADLRGANLKGAKLAGANLKGTILENAPRLVAETVEVGPSIPTASTAIITSITSTSVGDVTEAIVQDVPSGTANFTGHAPTVSVSGGSDPELRRLLVGQTAGVLYNADALLTKLVAERSNETGELKELVEKFIDSTKQFQESLDNPAEPLDKPVSKLGEKLLEILEDLENLLEGHGEAATRSALLVLVMALLTALGVTNPIAFVIPAIPFLSKDLADKLLERILQLIPNKD